MIAKCDTAPAAVAAADVSAALFALTLGVAAVAAAHGPIAVRDNPDHSEVPLIE